MLSSFESCATLLSKESRVHCETIWFHAKSHRGGCARRRDDHGVAPLESSTAREAYNTQGDRDVCEFGAHKKGAQVFGVLGRFVRGER